VHLTRCFAAALSEHPEPAAAIGEVVGDVLDQVGVAPDLAVLFATDEHRGVMAELAHVVLAGLAPRALVGATSAAVLGGDREVEHAPGVALFAARCGPAEVLDFETRETGAGNDRRRPEPLLAARHHEALAGATALVLLADPQDFPLDALLTELARDHPGLVVVGGRPTGTDPGTSLVVGDRVLHRGAVGVALGPGQSVQPVLSQGGRPLGEPLVVTRSAGNTVLEIAGRPALTRAREALATLHPDDRGGARRGLHLGLALDEHRMDFGRGDFLVREVLATDATRGSLLVDGEVAIGTTVQFHVCDAIGAEDDLSVALSGHSAASALVFSDATRGVRLFGRPDHDAAAVCRAVQTDAVAGVFCDGVVAPAGGRSLRHGPTAAAVLFASDRRAVTAD
jgi:small ligand-binding sensory domain FIST